MYKYIHTCNICLNTFSMHFVSYKYVIKTYTFNDEWSVYKIWTKICTILTCRAETPLLKLIQCLVHSCMYCYI